MGRFGQGSSSPGRIKQVMGRQRIFLGMLNRILGSLSFLGKREKIRAESPNLVKDLFLVFLV